MTKQLSTSDHSRDAAGLTYAYPVLSRRAGGLSIGINLNPNNACNWRCIYCQVPGLRRGGAPKIDITLLDSELRQLLSDVLEGDFYKRFNVSSENRQIRDISISGDGEPTTAKEFEQVIRVLGGVVRDFELIDRIKLVLITNGSMVHKPSVKEGLAKFARLHGEVWFKFDCGTDVGMKRINNAGYGAEKAIRNLRICAELCHTWLQTCLFAIDGKPMSESEQKAYLIIIKRTIEDKIPLQGVLLYGLARPSQQPEASHLSPVDLEWLNDFAAKIEMAGLVARISH